MADHDLPAASPDPRPKPDACRRARRKRVGELLASGAIPGEVMETVCQEFGTSARTIRSDLAWVRRLWLKTDLKTLFWRRAIGVKRFELAFKIALANQQASAMVMAEVAASKLLGYWPAGTQINQDNRSLVLALSRAGSVSEGGLPEGLMVEVNELLRLPPEKRAKAFRERYGDLLGLPEGNGE